MDASHRLTVALREKPSFNSSLWHPRQLQHSAIFFSSCKICSHRTGGGQGLLPKSGHSGLTSFRKRPKRTPAEGSSHAGALGVPVSKVFAAAAPPNLVLAQGSIQIAFDGVQEVGGVHIVLVQLHTAERQKRHTVIRGRAGLPAKVPQSEPGLTCLIHGCSQPDPLSSSRSPLSPRRPSPESRQTWGGRGRLRDGGRLPTVGQCQRTQPPGSPLSLPKRAWGCSYLISCGLLSSLPRCCRPLVQAKMLAMGLVLVGRP